MENSTITASYLAVIDSYGFYPNKAKAAYRQLTTIYISQECKIKLSEVIELKYSKASGALLILALFLFATANAVVYEYMFPFLIRGGETVRVVHNGTEYNITYVASLDADTGTIKVNNEQNNLDVNRHKVIGGLDVFLQTVYDISSSDSTLDSAYIQVATARGLIDITSPTKGAVLVKGQPFTISWSGGYPTVEDPRYSVALELVREDETQVGWIQFGNQPSGSYSWDPSKVRSAFGQPYNRDVPDGKYKIRVTDYNEPRNYAGSVSDVFNIISGITIVTPSPLVNARVGSHYAVTIDASGPTGNYSWRVSQGSLPQGLTLNTLPDCLQTAVCLYLGEIIGTPSSAGAYTFTVTVNADPVGDGPNLTASKQFTLTVDPAPTSCTDTDGGKNYYSKGNVKYNLNFPDNIYEIMDSCSGSTLNEYYCDDQGNAQTEYYSCPNGCSDGACNPTNLTPSIKVTSPNGGETFVQGQNSYIAWSGGKNVVQIGLVRHNYTIGPDDPILGWIKLDAKPDSYVFWDTNSVCDLQMSLCRPVNPGNYKIMALSQDANGNLIISYGNKTPGNVDLSDAPFQIISPPTEICTDSDGGDNIYTKGTATGKELGTNNTVSKTDYCYDSNNVVENFCGDIYPGYPRGYVNNGIKSCPNGCSDGACIQSVGTIQLVKLGEQFTLNTGKTVEVTDYKGMQLKMTGIVWQACPRGVTNCGDKIYTVEVTIDPCYGVTTGVCPQSYPLPVTLYFSKTNSVRQAFGATISMLSESGSSAIFVVEKTEESEIIIKTDHSLVGYVSERFYAEITISSKSNAIRYGSWSYEGSLPPGLTLYEVQYRCDAVGCERSTRLILEGVPTQAGEYRIKITAKDSAGNIGSETFVVRILSGTETELIVTVPFTFSLLEGQTAVVANYYDVKIKLNGIERTGRLPGFLAKITVTYPSICTNEPCTPGFIDDFEIEIGQTVDIQGLKIRFDDKQYDGTKYYAVFYIYIANQYVNLGEQFYLSGGESADVVDAGVTVYLNNLGTLCVANPVPIPANPETTSSSGGGGGSSGSTPTIKECTTEQDCINLGKCTSGMECTCLNNKCYAGAVACTQEAKICPDGTAVGRTGPNCEFAPCPGIACSQPICDGVYDTGQKDSYGCPIYRCPGVACYIPACAGAYDTGKKYPNGCPIYSCSGKAACSWRPTKDYGACEMLLGYYYNGNSCVAAGGCGTYGDVIPFGTLKECAVVCEQTTGCSYYATISAGWTGSNTATAGQSIPVGETLPFPELDVQVTFLSADGERAQLVVNRYAEATGYVGTDKQKYIPNEPVTIRASLYSPVNNLKAVIYRPDGTRDVVQLYRDTTLRTLPDNTQITAVYMDYYYGTYGNANIFGDYKIVLDADEEIRHDPARFTVFDSRLLGRYLILSSIEDYKFVTADVQQQNYEGMRMTMYIAGYSGPQNVGAVVAEFDSRKDAEKALEMIRKDSSYVFEDVIDGNDVLIMSSGSNRGVLWTNKNFIIVVMPNLPLPGVAVTEQTTAQVQVAEAQVTGRAVAEDVAPLLVLEYCGSGSPNPRCYCNEDEIKEASTPACSIGIPCPPPTYKCQPQTPLMPYPVIEAYLAKYKSDLGQEPEEKDVDSEDLLEVVFKLENLKRKFDELQRNAQDLARYYASQNDTESAARFERVAGMFGEAKDKVEEIKATIRANINNPDAIIDSVKEDIAELKSFLRDILLIMLGVEETIEPGETGAQRTVSESLFGG